MTGKKIVVVCLVVIAIVISALFLFTWGFSQQVTTDTLHDMQKNPPENYVDRLEKTILTHPDPAIRQQAVFALTDIAISNNESEKITVFLKDLAMQQKDEGVMAAAYANLDLIRTANPPEQNAFFDIFVGDPIRTGKNITITANVSVLKKPYKTLIGVQRLPADLALLSDPVVQVDVSPDSTRKIAFTVILNKTGSCCVPIKMIASYDRLDADIIKKRVCFTANESTGSYNVSEVVVLREE